MVLFSATLFLGCFLIASSASAATYYVDKDGVGGICSDSNTKAQAQNTTSPWCTIDKASSNAATGDVVIIRAGIYREQIWLSATGVTYQAATGETVIIKGTKAKTGFSLTAGQAYTYQTAETATNLLNVVIEEDTNTFYVSKTSKEEVEATASTYYLDPDLDLLYIHTSDSADPSTHTIGAYQYSSILGGNQNNTTLTDLILADGYYGVYTSSTNLIINNCTFYNFLIDGIYTAGSNSTITGSTFHHIARRSIRLISGSNHTVNRNVFYSNTYGIVADSAGSNFTIKNNIFYNNQPNFRLIGTNYNQAATFSNGSNYYIYNNVFYNNGYNNIDVDEALGFNTVSNIDVRNNIFYKNLAYAIYEISVTGTHIVQYNIFYQNYSAPTYVHQLSSPYFSFDTTNQYIDPLFTNPSAYDFTLQKNSPAINAGATIADVADDYLGNSRPNSNSYDIGAYEYQNVINRPVIATDGGNGAGKDFSTT
ncbi:MAG: right-handed parallel beta-helix repeat-containing protein, partial [Candidatus Moranbacteria bacterium]|nr:right-handed parallel beta-helix repeat-containing protein [Candidatus Moranbacteria bacterium]